MISEGNFKSTHRRAPDCYKKTYEHKRHRQMYTHKHTVYDEMPPAVSLSEGKSILQSCVICYYDFITGPNTSVCQEMDECHPFFFHPNRCVSSLVSAWLPGANRGPHPSYLLYWPSLCEGLKRKDGDGWIVTSFRTRPNKGLGSCGVVFISLVN